MRCANPRCDQTAQDLQDGILRLIELDLPPEDRLLRIDGGFPICTAPSKYFWLCTDCSKAWTIKRWTIEGLHLEPRGKTAGIDPQNQTLPQIPAKAVHSVLPWPKTFRNSA